MTTTPDGPGSAASEPGPLSVLPAAEMVELLRTIDRRLSVVEAFVMRVSPALDHPLIRNRIRG